MGVFIALLAVEINSRLFTVILEFSLENDRISFVISKASPLGEAPTLVGGEVFFLSLPYACIILFFPPLPSLCDTFSSRRRLYLKIFIPTSQLVVIFSLKVTIKMA